MGLFNSNYSAPGPGVSKNARRKKGIARFYEIFFRKFWDLIKLNILYIVTLLPTFAVIFLLSGIISNKFGYSESVINALQSSNQNFSEIDAANVSVTMDLLIRFTVSVVFTILWGGGPATAGFVYILRSFLWEEPVFLVSDYFKRIRMNFKQSLTVWIIDIIVFVLLCLAYFVYNSMPSILYFLKYVILVLAFFYTMLHLYINHLMVTYELSIPQLYKNSALFALSSLPFSVLTVFVVSFVILIFPAIAFTSVNDTIAVVFMILVIAIVFLMLFSFCGLYIECNAITQIKKYIKEEVSVERGE